MRFIGQKVAGDELKGPLSETYGSAAETLINLCDATDAVSKQCITEKKQAINNHAFLKCCGCRKLVTGLAGFKSFTGQCSIRSRTVGDTAGSS